MADIFISYSKDERDLTVALARDLKAQGYSVWWDASLLAGDVFEEVIMAELEKAKVAIVIWTKSSVKSMWVKSEARRAAESGKLIPLRTPNIATRELPPPFDGYQTNLVGEREKLYTVLDKRMPGYGICPSGQISTQTLGTATGALIVTRPRQFSGMGSGIKLFADGKEFGCIGSNSIERFTLPAGSILLEAKVMTWLGLSGFLFLEIVANHPTTVQIQIRTHGLFQVLQLSKL